MLIALGYLAFKIGKVIPCLLLLSSRDPVCCHEHSLMEGSLTGSSLGPKADGQLQLRRRQNDCKTFAYRRLGWHAMGTEN